jgi:hypothetical protein
MRATTRVAGIYGPNAAGKSNILSAIAFAADAVRLSATAWADRASLPHHPFLLDDEHRQQPSFYEFSLVIAGVRHDYGFTSNKDGIQSEWLYSYPEGRRRRTFVRESSGTDRITFARGPAYAGHTALLPFVGPRKLILSVAANARHDYLGPIHDHIARIGLTTFTESGVEARLRLFRESLDESTAAAAATILLRLADTGIQEVQVKKEESAALRFEDMRNTVRWDSTAAAEQPTSPHSGPPTRRFTILVGRQAFAFPNAAADTRRVLEFSHLSRDGSLADLSEADQSSGTLAWLALATLAWGATESGEIVLVDELAASLHPFLSATLIKIFKDAELNHSGAQLIFTTHDTSFLRPSVEALEPAETWFVEKRDGASELYSLAEFPTRDSDNFAKRYLDGRYGAVPIVALDELRELRRRAADR